LFNTLLTRIHIYAQAPHGDTHAQLDALFGTSKVRLLQGLDAVAPWPALGSARADVFVAGDCADGFAPHLRALRDRLAAHASGTVVGGNEFAMDAPAQSTYLRLPVPVHYTHAVVDTRVRYGHADFAALQVLAVVLQHDYLHREVREKGGAYGASAGRSVEGLFALQSLWDPSLAATLEAFARGLEWACSARMEQRAIDEALLSIFSDLDAPTSPSSKGVGQWLHGLTEPMRAQHRAALLAVDADALARVAGKYLAVAAHPGAFAQARDGAVSVCVVGSKGAAADGLGAHWAERVM